MNEWIMDDNGEHTAIGTQIPVIADGDVFAAVRPIWSDVDGVRVSVDWQAGSLDGLGVFEDISIHQARALADVLTNVADTPPPL